jgi:Uma2 family endonuclease
MGLPQRREPTYDDVLAAPEHLVAELVAGELHLSPRPAKPHAAAAFALAEELGPPFKRGRGGPGGWLLLFEPELHLGRDVLVPDLAGWRRARMPRLDPAEPHFTLAPDWICEILSPSTERLDRSQKLATYRRESVPHVWLVNPLTRTLEVLALREGHYAILAVHQAKERVRAEPFEAFELDLAVLWEDVDWGA